MKAEHYYHAIYWDAQNPNKKEVHLNGLKDWTLSEQALDKAMQFVLDTIEIPDTIIKMLRDKQTSKRHYVYNKMKLFSPKHSRYIEVSAPTIIFLISSDTFSQTASQIIFAQSQNCSSFSSFELEPRTRLTPCGSRPTL